MPVAMSHHAYRIQVLEVMQKRGARTVMAAMINLGASQKFLCGNFCTQSACKTVKERSAVTNLTRLGR